MALDIFDNDDLNDVVEKKVIQPAAEHFNQDEETIRDKYKQFTRQLMEAKPGANDQNIASSAQRRLEAHFGSTNQDTSGDNITFNGIFLAAGERDDIGEKWRAKKIRKFKDDEEEALKNGELHLVKEATDEDKQELSSMMEPDRITHIEVEYNQKGNERKIPLAGVPDEVEEIKGTKIIPVATEDEGRETGDRIPKHIYTRKIFGVAKPKNQEDVDWQPCTIQLTGDQTNKPIKFNQVMEFEGWRKGTMERFDKEEYQLGINGEWEPNHEIEPDLKEIFEETLGHMILDYDDIDDYLKQARENNIFDPYFIIKGTILGFRNLEGNSRPQIDVKEDDFTSIGISGYDEEGKAKKSVTASMDKHVPTKFSDGSGVYIIATGFQGTNDEGESRRVILGHGVFSPPEHKTDKPETQNIEENIEEENEEEEISEDFGDDFDDEINSETW